MANSQVEKIMKLLGCSEEEALNVIECDKAIDKGQKMDFDLSPEAEKEAKKMANVKSYKKSETKVERKRKENPTKATLIAEIAQFLTENGYENVEIVNKERQITLKSGENDYELTLVQKRKKKS